MRGAYESHYEHRVHAETVRADVIQMSWPSLRPYVGQPQFQTLHKYGYTWVTAQSPLKPLESQTHNRRVAGNFGGDSRVKTLVR